MFEFSVGDETLLVLEARLTQLERAAMVSTDDATLDDIGLQMEALEREIATTPAISPAGVAVKLRRLWSNLEGGASAADEGNYSSAIQSLEWLQMALAEFTPGNARH